MEYLLKASVVIAVFYLCYYLLLKKETFFQHNRWFLLIGLIIAIVFPLIVIPVYIPIESTTLQESIFTTSVNHSTFTEDVVETTFNWKELSLIVYTIGLSIFSIQFIFQFGSLIVLLIKNPKYKDQNFTYIIVKNKISPFSFFKWIVYNPKSYKEEELQLILIHEKVHATQLHSIDILLTQLACVVFWFNPLIWLYRKEIRQNLEYIADLNTQISTSTKKEYQHLLLKTSIANHNTLLSNNFYNSSIKKRIFMLNKTRSKQKNQLKYLLMLPLLAGLLISMNSKKIYLEAELLNNIEPINTKDSITHESIKLKFTNQMNDDRLEEFKTLLESKGVTMKIKSLKRNQDDKISSINIVFESKNRTTNYSSKIKEGILPFYFEMTDESIEVYNIKDIEYNENTLVAAYNIQKPNDTLYFKTIDSAKVQSLSKEKSDLYYEGGKTLKITTKNDDLIINQPQKKYKAISTATNNNQKPLIIIDGKEADYELLKYLNPNLIESMTVLKDNKAIDAYGDKGKNGVIILITKENTTEKNTTKTKNNNPWKAIGKSEINSLTYIDDENPSKNESIAYISKSSTDQILDSHINELKRIGITVKYSKLKRNKVGEITSIKISLEDNEGSKSSATWKVTNGIPDIEFGKSEGSLIARTK
ncbi:MULTISPECIES: M56 family metallopeptidase [Winogradskyella]|uniref:M56 family metallopeptidase n=1 Tax=Winogradskyella TaxID=286104 RepID=UPI0015CC56A2|nr:MULTISPECIES: M56 family metallopeptidase [Winogradskyella]QXP79801.1 hypothetical protein H0I32_03935 [Winogradskyella sp. HaHa_3_26]